MERKYLTTSETADRLSVTSRAVTKWASAGTLPAAVTTPGGHRRFDPDVVDAFAHRYQQPVDLTGIRAAVDAFDTAGPDTDDDQRTRLAVTVVAVILRAIFHTRPVPVAGDDITDRVDRLPDDIADAFYRALDTLPGRHRATAEP